MPSQLKYYLIPGKHHNLQCPEAVQTDLLICPHPFSFHPGFCLPLVTSCPLFLIIHHKHPDKVHCPSDFGQIQPHHSSFSIHKISKQSAMYLSTLLMHKSKAYMLPDHLRSDFQTDIQNTSHIIPRTFLKVRYPQALSCMLRCRLIITVL